jgi:hypothetical protein
MSAPLNSTGNFTGLLTMRNKTLVLCLAAALAALPAASAHAQRMYKCVDPQGKVYYTQVPPRECLGQTTQELSGQGRVIKHNEVVTPEKRAAMEAEKKRRAEQAKADAEERRKARALLSSYSSEKDIEEARARALKDAEKSLAQQMDQTLKAVKGGEQRITSARKRIDEHKKFYGSDKLPAKALEDIEKAEGEIAQAEAAIKKHRDAMEQQKKKYIDPINARYDEDKRRYLELTKAVAER